jgi:hypothetical protein
MRNSSLSFSRLANCANAVLIRLPHLHEVTLLDLSLHAAMVASSGYVDVVVGDAVRLRVLTPRGNCAFEVDASVAYRAAEYIGLQIASVDAHARSALLRLVEMKHGSAASAARTLPALLEAHRSCVAGAAHTFSGQVARRAVARPRL